MLGELFTRDAEQFAKGVLIVLTKQRSMASDSARCLGKFDGQARILPLAIHWVLGQRFADEQLQRIFTLRATRQMHANTELLMMAAGLEVPLGISEYDYTGVIK